MKPHCLNALVLSALFVLGCSETEEVVGKQHDAGIPAELLESAQRLGTAWAGKEAACEKAELELTRAYWTAFFENQAAAVAPGGLLFDPAAVTPCVAAMESLACHEVGLSIPPVLPAACDEVFYGTAAIGEPCNPGCERGATCLLARQSDAWCSRCVKRLVEGEVCTDEPAEGRCASGLVCSGGKCARPRAIEQGQPCDRFDAAAVCEAGSYCAESELCEPRKTSGGCFWSDECAPGYSCVEGGCQRWKSRGATCSSPDECEPHASCSDPGGCDAEPFFVFFKAGVGVGQSCAEDPCQPALACSEQSSVCELLPRCE